MRAVKQKHPTGCGVAAVAMVAGTKYDDALEAIFPNHKRKRMFKTTWADVRNGLNYLGVTYGDLWRKKTSLSGLAGAAKLTRKPCIVRVAEKTGVRDSHFLVINKGGKVYDPWAGKAIMPDIYPVVRSWMEVEPD